MKTTAHPQAQTRPLRILEVSASGRRGDSVSRQLTGELVRALQDSAANAELHERDLGNGIPLVNDEWIAANFTDEGARSPKDHEALATSDTLVDEVKEADVLVIGSPIYNFGVPAALKAWIDMIARARVTFRYTENGPEGLLADKKAYIVVASGGVAVDSEYDFATPYLRHALRFLGITDIEVISAERLNVDADAAVASARQQISALVLAGQSATTPVAHTQEAQQ